MLECLSTIFFFVVVKHSKSLQLFLPWSVLNAFLLRCGHSLTSSPSICQTPATNEAKSCLQFIRIKLAAHGLCPSRSGATRERKHPHTQSTVIPGHGSSRTHTARSREQKGNFPLTDKTMEDFPEAGCQLLVGPGHAERGEQSRGRC